MLLKSKFALYGNFIYFTFELVHFKYPVFKSFYNFTKNFYLFIELEKKFGLINFFSFSTTFYNCLVSSQKITLE